MFAVRRMKNNTRVLIKKLVSFTSRKFNVVSNTRKNWSLILLKDKVQHLSCVIYKCICSCGETYSVKQL